MSVSSSSSSASFRLQDPADPTSLRGATPIVTATFYDGKDFLLAFSSSRGRSHAAELAVVTRAQPEPGSWAVVEIDWRGLPNPVYVRARLYPRRFGVMARLHPDERSAAKFLHRMARGEPTAYHLRAHRRYCVRLPVWWRRFGSTERLAGIAEDLSAGGMLISALAPPPVVGERVGLRLLVPSAQQDLIITGTVMHTRTRSQDSSFGVRFALRSSGEQRTLRRLLRAFAARGVVTLE
jgi:PilZ domain